MDVVAPQVEEKTAATGYDARVNAMSKTKIVILNWNGREHLRRFLPSVISTTPAEVEIIVADNGSDDDSLDILKNEFPSVGIIELDRNYGFAQGYNMALKDMDADYFILLNSDVETTKGWCEPLINALESDSRLAAVSPKILSYSDRTKFEYAGAAGGFIDILGYPFCRGRILSRTEEDHGQYDTDRHAFWASGACMACRKELFTELGGFDGDFFAHMEEIDLCWRAQLSGYRIGVVTESVVYHLGGGTLPDNSPRKIYLNYRNNIAMLYKNLPKRKLIVILPVRMIMDGVSAIVYLFTGKFGFFKNVFKAHIDFYKQLKTLRLKRREIQSAVKATPEGIYRGSVILRYIFVSKRFGDML